MSTVVGFPLKCPSPAARRRTDRLGTKQHKCRLAATFELCSNTSKHASMSDTAPLVYVIMGVSGCGKSTVGALLAEKLHCPFYDADDFHPPENIRKMTAGQPLTDSDRWPWLQQLAQIIQKHVQQDSPAVLSCSALKPAYRHVLRGTMAAAAAVTGETQQSTDCKQDWQKLGVAAATPGAAVEDVQQLQNVQPVQQDVQQPQQTRVAFVLLNPTRDELIQRVQQRAATSKHFMPPALLDSQLEQLSYTPDELYLCFGCGCNSQFATDGLHHADGAAGGTDALRQCSPMPTSKQIVDAILSQSASNVLG